MLNIICFFWCKRQASNPTYCPVQIRSATINLRGEWCAHIFAKPRVHKGGETGLSIALEAQEMNHLQQRRWQEADA